MPFQRVHALLMCMAVMLLTWAPARGLAAEVEPLPPTYVSLVDDMFDREIHDDLPPVAPTDTVALPADCWTRQVLPDGLMYKSYLAGPKEPRFASQWVNDKTFGWMWDIALGGRVGILRDGTRDALNPQGWQLDMEGAAFPRLDLEHNNDLVACDYRFGIPLTHAIGPHHYKVAYYHLSSHLGDEWMIRYHDAERINYSRDVAVFGYSYYPSADLRLYGEVGYAFCCGERTEPLEFQFGVEYSPAQPTGLHPVPFMAFNGHLREECDFGGSVTAQSGWQWRGATGNLFRMGMQCFVGMSDQFEFYNQYECKVGFGLWYDY